MTILFDNYNLNRFAQKMAGDADALRSSPVPEQDNLSGTRPGPAGQTPLPLSEERKDPPTRGPAGILVVDDEQLIREVLKRFLQLAGFRVFLAASGHEAVELYRHQAEAINAVRETAAHERTGRDAATGHQLPRGNLSTGRNLARQENRKAGHPKGWPAFLFRDWASGYSTERLARKAS